MGTNDPNGRNRSPADAATGCLAEISTLPPTDPASVEAMTDGYTAHTRLFAPSFAKDLRLSTIWIDGSKYSFGLRTTCRPHLLLSFTEFLLVFISVY